MDREIILYHKDWYGQCKINKKNKIKRLTDINETGIISFKKNQIEVKWEKWSNDVFFYIQDNIYIEKTYIFEHLELILLLKLIIITYYLIIKMNIISFMEIYKIIK